MMIFVFLWTGNVPGQTPASAPDGHREAACSLCHGGSGGFGAVAGGSADRSCLTCHDLQAQGAASVATFHAGTGRDCTSCHSFHDPTVLKSSQVIIAPGTPDLDSGHCRGCHGPDGDLARISEAHRAAAALYHGAGRGLERTSPSESCLNCHAADSASPWRQATASRLTFSTHASHPYGVAVIPGQGNAVDHISWSPDPRLPLFSGRMECQSCHLLTSGTAYDLIPYRNPYDLCLGCHEHEAGPGRGTGDLLAARDPR